MLEFDQHQNARVLGSDLSESIDCANISLGSGLAGGEIARPEAAIRCRRDLIPSIAPATPFGECHAGNLAALCTPSCHKSALTLIARDLIQLHTLKLTKNNA